MGKEKRKINIFERGDGSKNDFQYSSDYSLPIGLQFRVRYYSNLRRLTRPPFEFRNFSAALHSLDSRSFRARFLRGIETVLGGEGQRS